MFWEKFILLCNKHGESPNSIAKQIGIASGTITNWKNGVQPRYSAVKKLSEYFGVPVDYLLEKENAPSPENRHSITIRGRDGSVIESDLTDEQIELFKQMLKQMTEKK